MATSKTSPPAPVAPTAPPAPNAPPATPSSHSRVPKLPGSITVSVIDRGSRLPIADAWIGLFKAAPGTTGTSYTLPARTALLAAARTGSFARAAEELGEQAVQISLSLRDFVARDETALGWFRLGFDADTPALRRRMREMVDTPKV